MVREATLSNMKHLHACCHVTGANIIGQLSRNAVEGRGNRIRLLAPELFLLDSSDRAQDISGEQLPYSKQFHCVNQDRVCELLDLKKNTEQILTEPVGMLGDFNNQ